MPKEQVMSPEERLDFLEGVHIGVLAVDEPGRGPLTAPVWYRVVDGSIEIGIGGSSKKAQLLRAARRATLLVQVEDPPYRYVSVEGPIEFVDHGYDMLAFATRYLGPELGTWYAEHTPSDSGTAVVTLQPSHWRSQDFSGPSVEEGVEEHT
jgi:nitroimidazol reductase NimA-like FMN-containing flavoprotein (pyridoxamine 5'-phosphate oxidase superfamily)